MSVSPSEIAYEKAHAADYNATGFTAFLIAGICIVTVTVALRFWSRRIQRTTWQSDDYTLLVALIITIGSMFCYVLMSTHYGSGRHFYSLPVSTQVHFLKTQYAFNILYTISYPLSRISLVLLYRRVFVQQWYQVICNMFVFVYAGYAISTALADVWLTIPINAYWDSTITPSRKVNEDKLYLANAAFNISTDCVMLLLPLTVVWRLHMEWMQKVGLSLIFGLGGVTMVASIMRLRIFFKVDSIDPTYGFTVSSFWTAGEQFLGILCPCLVTFRPLIKSARRVFTSHISSRSRHGYRLDRAQSTVDEGAMKRDHRHCETHTYGIDISDHPDTDPERQSVSKLVAESYQPPLAPQPPKKNILPFLGRKHNKAQDAHPPFADPHWEIDHALKAPTVPAPSHQKSRSWRERLGISQSSGSETTSSSNNNNTNNTNNNNNNINDAVALASLDPRAHASTQQEPHAIGENDNGEHGGGGNYSKYGTRSEVKAVPLANTPPTGADGDREQGTYPINIQREYILERE